jgi:pimeloyl-ACP methyl ester carboxylesterase
LILWGHSNGWAISIKLANRNKIKILRLILNNSAWIRNDKKRSLKRKILNIISKLIKKINPSPSGEVRWGLKKIRKLFYRAIGSHDYLNAEKNPKLKQTYLNMISSDLKEEIKNIKNHTLLIWWEKDNYTPVSDAYFMRKNIKNSKLIILDNETHWIHLKNPDRLVKTFLQNI